MNINSISEKTQVSTATIIRFARDFGFKGFLDFKTSLQKDIRKKLKPIDKFHSLNNKIDAEQAIVKVAEQEMININTLISNIEKEKIKELVDTIHKAERVYTFGAGISKIFSKMITYLFNQINKESHCLDEGIMSPQRKLLNLTDNDVLILSSFPPYSIVTIKVAKIAFENGIKLISFTDNELSPISKFSKMVFPIPTDNLLFTNSIAAFSVFANSLSTELALKDKENIVSIIKGRDKILKDFYF